MGRPASSFGAISENAIVSHTELIVAVPTRAAGATDITPSNASGKRCAAKQGLPTTVGTTHEVGLLPWLAIVVDDHLPRQFGHRHKAAVGLIHPGLLIDSKRGIGRGAHRSALPLMP